MTIRITGMSSGLDTESIITELTKAKQTTVDKIKSDQKKYEKKQDKWKELNTKVVSFYKGKLNNIRFEGTFNKKTTTVSDEDAATVVTGSTAMNSQQTLNITQLAKSGYLTGGEVESETGSDITQTSTLSSLGMTSSGKMRIYFGATDGDQSEQEYVDIEVNADDTIASFVSKINSAESDSGYKVNASFDTSSGRFYMASAETGAEQNFYIDDMPHGTTTDDEGNTYAIEDTSTEFLSVSALSKLGLTTATGWMADGDTEATTNSTVATYQEGSDASITLNGVEYTSSDNTFEINGLTITANQVAENVILNTKTDTSGIYDTIKEFLTEYNEIIKEFDTLYNADDSDDYDILTAEQEEEMTDEEIEEWNNKIDEGLLSGDTTLGKLRQAMKSIMLSTYSLTDKNGNAVTGSLSYFGIATGSYFATDENERGMYHIDGDEDDETTSSNEDKLSALIASDPDLVSDFFNQLGTALYSKLGDLMKSTDFSSSFTIYDDKLMKKQYNKFSTELEKAQEELTELEDYYYDKFSSMETALSKLDSSSSALSGLT
ncbi:MAG: flagellar filament capping protein FliD, partial [Butyrivibrio sp.]|nr:flagellar filament capping protein FliD [Butyrivibrio sp.]